MGAEKRPKTPSLCLAQFPYSDQKLCWLETDSWLAATNHTGAHRVTVRSSRPWITAQVDCRPDQIHGWPLYSIASHDWCDSSAPRVAKTVLDGRNLPVRARDCDYCRRPTVHTDYTPARWHKKTLESSWYVSARQSLLPSLVDSHLPHTACMLSES